MFDENSLADVNLHDATLFSVESRGTCTKLGFIKDDQTTFMTLTKVLAFLA